jgi:methylthioribose-1-phosphate isomerase
MNLQLFAGMENQDLVNVELKEKIKVAIESNDSEAFAQAQYDFARQIEEKILSEAKTAMNEDISDRAVMASRGLNPLTKMKSIITTK